MKGNRNSLKTHCPQGHPYDDENTRWYRGGRRCKACDRDRANRRYAAGRKPTTPPFEGSMAFFLARSQVSFDNCWIWTGRWDSAGYGRWGAHLAHRLSYEFFIGPVPQELVLDHVCRNRACVNPNHLEAVTQQENVRRGFADRKVAS